jgi:V/A-type H+-transporting ATPase subunit I
MSKIKIFGPIRLLDEAINVMHSLGIVHLKKDTGGIKDTSIQSIPLEKDKLDLKNKLIKLNETLEGIFLLIPKPKIGKEIKTGPSEYKDLPLEELSSVVKKIDANARTLSKERLRLKEKLSVITKYEKLLKGFAPLMVKLKEMKLLETRGLVIDKEQQKALPLIEEELKRICNDRYQIFIKELDEQTVGVVLTYPKQYDKPLKSFLSGENISEVVLPKEYEEMSLLAALKDMVKNKEILPVTLAKVESELAGISEKWYYWLANYKKAVRDLIDEVSIINYCVQTKYAFIISGWVPVDKFSETTKIFEDKFGGSVDIKAIAIENDEMSEVPVCIQNRSFFKPFEVLLSILPTPKYGSIDPTPYLAIFFPAFFGIILGDVGYGIILLLLSSMILKGVGKKEPYYSILTIFIVASLYAILFGLFFGEIFGSLGEKFGLHPLLFDRLKAIKWFMVLSIAIGLFHVLLGLVLGTISSLSMKKGKKAVAKISQIFLIVAIIVLIGVMAEFVPKTYLTPTLIIVIFFLPLLVVFEGIIGPLEFMKNISNILSYIRLMAIGTASVVLALVANKLGGMASNIFLGIAIAVILHGINILLGILSPTIQSLRLHYVEFFSKFYEPGGMKYNPFKKTQSKGGVLWK